MRGSESYGSKDNAKSGEKRPDRQKFVRKSGVQTVDCEFDGAALEKSDAKNN